MLIDLELWHSRAKYPTPFLWHIFPWIPGTFPEQLSKSLLYSPKTDNAFFSPPLDKWSCFLHYKMLPVICMSPFKKSLLGICCALHIKQSWLLGTAQKPPLVMSTSHSRQLVFLLGCHTSHWHSALHLCWNCFVPGIKPSFCLHPWSSPSPSFTIRLPRPCPAHTSTLL